MKVAGIVFLAFIAMISANTLVDKFSCVIEGFKKRFKTASCNIHSACQNRFKRAVDYCGTKKSEAMEKASGLMRKYMKTTEKKVKETAEETENDESTFDSNKATPSEIMEMIRRMLEEQTQQEETAEEDKKKEAEVSEKKEL
eukprot:jgi/Antlo1/489/487